MRIYLDSVVVIYLVEQPTHFGQLATQAYLALNPTVLVGNELLRMECLVVPRRANDPQREADFEQFFRHYPPFVPLDRPVFEQAIDLRAKYVFLKTPDALHLATAIVSGCDAFVTNEPKLARVQEIRVVLI